MDEQLIIFETAKLAKEKGFNIFTGKAWIEKEEQELFFTSAYTGVTNGIDYHAPTQSLLQRWLREVHEIDVNVLPYNKNKKYYEVWVEKSNITWSNFSTYEEALEVGLYESLKLIK